MVEGITADMIQMLMDREGYKLSQAIDAVYNSDIYSALLRPTSGLYAQSPGYVYNYLLKEQEEKGRSNLGDAI